VQLTHAAPGLPHAVAESVLHALPEQQPFLQLALEHCAPASSSADASGSSLETDPPSSSGGAASAAAERIALSLEQAGKSAVTRATAPATMSNDERIHRSLRDAHPIRHEIDRRCRFFRSA
jgi:hypothetical protein